MTKKDYILIETAFSEYEGTQQGVKEVAELLSYYLLADNPKFSRERFLNACELNINKKKEAVCSVVDCQTVRLKDGSERYYNGQIVCDKHAAKIDGF